MMWKRVRRWPICRPTCLALPRRWHAHKRSPFERVRIMDPPANLALNEEAMANLISAWPAFEKAEIADAWAGVIDVTPDSNPVIGPVARIPGLTLATGFSGHGFGTSPAAGQLAADIVSNHSPIIRQSLARNPIVLPVFNSSLRE
ncbi:FAD dependent oxidoreductase [Erwinia amylovora Ea644]|nr:FAD dependent oxidoreductase [Erwinia amylovora Ea644]